MSDYLSKFCIEKDGLFREYFNGDNYCGSNPNPVCIYRTNRRILHSDGLNKQGCVYQKKDEVPPSDNPMVVTLTEVLKRIRQQDF